MITRLSGTRFLKILVRKALLLLLGAAVVSLTGISTLQAGQSKDTTDLMHNIKFRNIGPAAAGGRVTSVLGLPGQPDIYYVGTAGGGVFKTSDGGVSWKAIFKNEPSLSIGAMAIAPSNPNYIWVGTGEANLRNDIITGKGIFFSPDAGKTWQFMGLKDVGQISRIAINPTDPNNVFVAAIGHAWAPNPERGIFRTTDGGKTWQKVLFVNDTTGASDLVMDPGNPKVLFAAMWQVVRYPWALNDGGPGSGIYRSTDGGTTWKKLTRGLPKGPLGRIALAAAPSNPDHIYALIESKKGMLWDSQDLGSHWSMVTDNHELDVRPFYFSRVVVSPDNQNKLYFMSFLITESTDGGKTVKSIEHGVHVDHHDLWLDPKDPNRMIDGNDGGAYVTVDGGKTWRFLNNLPIEQFYQVAVDSSHPFNIGGGLQDNNAWYGVSTNLYGGGVTGQDWFPVAGGDGQYVVPAPSDPNIVYAEAQNGWMKRLNIKTGLWHYIRPYLWDAPDMPPSKLKYRFNWTTPIAVSYTNPNEVFVGANVLFKTYDGGLHWTVMSPDLTRNDKAKQYASGGNINLDVSGAENYDTILSIGLSPIDSNVVWIGTDDGLVQVTRDGGRHWENVARNIPHLPQWGRICQIAPSPFNQGSCYIAVDFHELDNNKPYVFKTDDYGKTWTSISNGFPEGYPVHVVREDPNMRGFLVAGTDHGLFYSRNDGRNWEQLKSNFPSACVYDLQFVKSDHDLVVATHGRGIFVLDNITPLEEFNNSVRNDQFHLFTALPAYMYHTWYRDALNDLATYSAPNAPIGAVINYYLKDTVSATAKEKKEHQTPVKIVITDEARNHIATVYGPAKKGFNRYVWNMRYQGPKHLKITPKMASNANPYSTGGPMVTPGSYNLAVTFNGHTENTHVTLRPDPRIKFPEDYFTSNLKDGLTARNSSSALNEMMNRIHSIEVQMNMIKQSLANDQQGMKDGKYKPVLDGISSLDKKLTSLEDTLYTKSVQHNVGEDDIHAFTHFHSRLSGLLYNFMSPYNGAPTEVIMHRTHRLEKLLGVYLAEFNDILNSDIPEFNSVAEQRSAPTIFAGPDISVKK